MKPPSSCSSYQFRQLSSTCYKYYAHPSSISEAVRQRRLLLLVIRNHQNSAFGVDCYVSGVNCYASGIDDYTKGPESRDNSILTPSRRNPLLQSSVMIARRRFSSHSSDHRGRIAADILRKLTGRGATKAKEKSFPDPDNDAAESYAVYERFINANQRRFRKRLGDDDEFLGIDLSQIPMAVGSTSTNQRNEGTDLMDEWNEDERERRGAAALKRLTHVDGEGKAQMVNISNKRVTVREAEAEGFVKVPEEVIKLLAHNQLKKGDALTVSQIAGVMGAKKTSELIPLCHNILLNDVQVKLMLNYSNNSVKITCIVRTEGKTGAEMEALTGVSIAALTLYDMCKAASKDMQIEGVRLIRKTGGKSDDGKTAELIGSKDQRKLFEE